MDKVNDKNVSKSRFTRASEIVASPNLFQNETVVSMKFADSEIRFLANDLDAYLFSRSRLTPAQLAALSAQLEQHSSVFDSLTDEQRVQFLNSRYNQNFASVDNYRSYLLANLDKFDGEIKASLEEQSKQAQLDKQPVQPETSVVSKSD